jgi:transcriptional regulator with XRE-family HTH domain
MSTLGTMAAGGDPAALGQLLRSRRERLVPADVGLPAGLSAGRRRTAGLRREEVAMLANLSVTYYTFLEQGRPVRPSAQVLDALAAALRMSAAERRYLHVLAYGPGDASGSAQGAAGAAGAPGGSAPPELLDPAVADQAREVYLEWEPEARAMLGRFRLSAARHPDDPDIAALIAELQRDSEHVRDWWPRHDVTAIGGSGSKKLRHPRL